uniref:Uncharacterized protein n=1 Tax=Arion vulgaris TaxID=1028688 RepID=A0A0B7BEP7_9EUPU
MHSFFNRQDLQFVMNDMLLQTLRLFIGLEQQPPTRIAYTLCANSYWNQYIMPEMNTS